MNKKQERFVDEYLIDLNATKAAIRAGYSERTAEQIGFQLLKKTSVAAAVAERMKEREKRTEITQDSVLLDIEEIKRDAMRLVEEKDGSTGMANHFAALKAAELQGKHLGMFKDRVEHSGSVTIAAAPLDEDV